MALRLIFFNLNLILCWYLLMISERLLRVLAQYEKIFLFQAQLAYVFSTIVGWGAANNFPADGRDQSGVLTSPHIF